mgnify:CR=1 FL=1
MTSAPMTLEMRKLVTQTEEIHIEGGRPADPPLVMHGVAAVIANPWAGQGFVEDLRPAIMDLAPVLGSILVPRLVEMCGGGDTVEAYGKAAMVGTSGEVEHASALIHTLHFGNHYRNAVGAKSYLSFCNTRGPANAPLMIPLMDKKDGGRRSHYLTIQTSVADAPAADEILVALGASIGGRPHHRIGDRYQDLKELGHDVDNPASV